MPLESREVEAGAKVAAAVVEKGTASQAAS